MSPSDRTYASAAAERRPGPRCRPSGRQPGIAGRTDGSNGATCRGARSRRRRKSAPPSVSSTDPRHGILVARIDAVRGAEAFRKFELLVGQVDGDDRAGAHVRGGLNRAQAHAANAEDHHRVARSDVGRIDDRATPGGHRAADDGRHVGRRRPGRSARQRPGRRPRRLTRWPTRPKRAPPDRGLAASAAPAAPPPAGAAA